MGYLRRAHPDPEAPLMPDATKVLRPRRRLWLLGGLAFVLALMGLGMGAALATVQGLPKTNPSNAAASSGTDPSPAAPSESPSPSPSPEPSIPDGAFAIPDVAGQHLPDADKALKDAGFTNLVLQDASGQNRIVLDKNNWIVEATDPSGYATSKTDKVILKVRKPTDGKGSKIFQKGVMPDVTCKDLQDAQDGLKRAGYRVIVAEDASGQKRSTFFPRDWIVIGQSQPVGATPTAYTKITLRVIKFGEPVGDSGCES